MSQVATFIRRVINFLVVVTMVKKVVLPHVIMKTPRVKKHRPVKGGNQSKLPSSTRTPNGPGGTHLERILKAIASAHALGNARPEKKAVQVTSMILDNKVFGTVCATMKNKGLIVYDRTTIQLTEAGRANVGEEALAQPATNETFHDMIKKTFKSKMSRAIFDVLVDGGNHSKDEIAQTLNIENNKSFCTYLSALSKYTEKCNNGTYSLNDIAFPLGRPGT